MIAKLMQENCIFHESKQEEAGPGYAYQMEAPLCWHMVLRLQESA